MKKLLKYIDWRFRVVLVLVVLGALIGFTDVSNKDLDVKSIIVRLSNTTDNHFLEEEDIIEMMKEYKGGDLVGTSFHSLDLGGMEDMLELNAYIKFAEVYRDLEGNILVSAGLKRPVARIISPTAPDAYITSEGELLPVSEDFVARVMLIRADQVEETRKADFWNSEIGNYYLNVINYVNEDKFWKAQIAEMILDKDGKIKFLPQVGKQVIEFGEPGEMEEKFKKLKVFFTKVLPAKGWNSYERVNLEFKNQIIAE